MRKMISIFAYNQALAQNDELIRIRHEASIAEGVPETFASMFPAPRQRHIEDLVLNEEALMKIEHPTLLLHG
jgi:2-hydroxymuconate-semialdehyde hydrolase